MYTSTRAIGTGFPSMITTDCSTGLLLACPAFTQGIPLNISSIRGGMFSAGVEVACLLADVALRQMDDVCAEFFQADW